MGADAVAAFYSRALPEHARGRLLDLGCGNVPLYGTYRKHVTETVCVDWGNSGHEEGCRHLDLTHDLSQPLPFPDERFDTVLLSDVLEHLPEPDQTWSEIARVLSPGGKLIMNVPFFYWLHEIPHDYYRYTEYALRRFADRAGFQILYLAPAGGAPQIIVDVSAKMVGLYSGRLANLVHQVGAFVCRLRLIRKVSARSAKSMPMGYLLVAQKL